MTIATFRPMDIKNIFISNESNSIQLLVWNFYWLWHNILEVEPLQANDVVFCGRILMFLAHFFPLSERSGLFMCAMLVLTSLRCGFVMFSWCLQLWISREFSIHPMKPIMRKKLLMVFLYLIAFCFLCLKYIVTHGTFPFL